MATLPAGGEAGLIVRNPCSVKGAATERAAEMRVATVAQVAAWPRRSIPAYGRLPRGSRVLREVLTHPPRWKPPLRRS